MLFWLEGEGLLVGLLGGILGKLVLRVLLGLVLGLLVLMSFSVVFKLFVIITNYTKNYHPYPHNNNNPKS